MASPTQWTWVWASSRTCWWPGKPGVLQSVGLCSVLALWVHTKRQTWLTYYQKCEVSVCSSSVLALWIHTKAMYELLITTSDFLIQLWTIRSVKSVPALHLCLYSGTTPRLNELLITPFDFLTEPRKKENTVEYICHRCKLTSLRRNSARKARNKITHQSSSSSKRKIQPATTYP